MRFEPPEPCSIAKLKARLSAFIERASKGREILVTDHNRPVARIVPVRRVPALPRADLRSFLEEPPIPLRKGAPGAAEVVRRIRDEETH